MHFVSVRGHMMIAHSLQGAVFGPAQQLHGATYIVDVEFRTPDLDRDGIVVDIGRASKALHAILGGLSYRNLDDDPAFQGRNTTTEYLARVIFDRMCDGIRCGDLGPAARRIESIRVTLQESHLAAAGFEGDVEVMPVPSE